MNALSKETCFENMLYLRFLGFILDAGLRRLHRTLQAPQGEASLWAFTNLEMNAIHMDFSLNGIPNMSYLQWNVSQYLFLTQKPQHL